MRNDSHDEKTFPKARSFEVRAAFCRFVSAFIFFRVGALALFFCFPSVQNTTHTLTEIKIINKYAERKKRERPERTSDFFGDFSLHAYRSSGSHLWHARCFAYTPQAPRLFNSNYSIKENKYVVGRPGWRYLQIHIAVLTRIKSTPTPGLRRGSLRKHRCSGCEILVKKLPFLLQIMKKISITQKRLFRRVPFYGFGGFCSLVFFRRNGCIRQRRTKNFRFLIRVGGENVAKPFSIASLSHTRQCLYEAFDRTLCAEHFSASKRTFNINKNRIACSSPMNSRINLKNIRTLK